MGEHRLVLVVDDEDTMQEIIAANLSRTRFSVDVHQATSGEEGIARYRELLARGERPDLVIMDVNLTQWGTGAIDGVEATRRIRTLDPEAKIIGYTAWNTHGIDKQLVEAGAREVVERTILPTEFRRIVEGYLAAA
jgi:CheY-like chemotaxis protein